MRITVGSFNGKSTQKKDEQHGCYMCSSSANNILIQEEDNKTRRAPVSIYTKTVKVLERSWHMLQFGSFYAITQITK